MTASLLLMFALIALLAVLIGTAIFQWLWNITMPEAFGLKTLHYWVAFRLLLIAAFLTSGFWIRVGGAS